MSALIALSAPVNLPDQNSLMHGEREIDPNRFGGQYHYMVNRYDNVAVIDIRGMLVTYDAWYNKYMGAVSYEEIRNAVTTVSRDQEITTVLLKVDSPGGSAKGADECAQFLRGVSENIVPIYTIACGDMASGGYLLGSVGAKIYVTDFSVVGSIGAIRQSMSYFRYLQEQGVDAEIFRSPEFKTLGQPTEMMSEKAREEIQKGTQYIAEVFEQYVAQNRKTTVEIVKRNYGQGKTFIGQQAIDNGLADELSTFDMVIRKLRSGNTNFI